MREEIDRIIAEQLNISKDLIESGRADEALALLGVVVNDHPELADDRFKAELGLIERLIYCRQELKACEYPRSFELVSKYCNRLYGNTKDLNYGRLGDEPLLDKDKIWVCWLQGLDNAPDIVKACVRSMSGLEREIVILDDGNIFEYVEMPGQIIDAYRQGRIGPAHYSDLVRLELLTNRGGMWIDSTVYISSSEGLKDIVDSCNLFAYRAVRADSISRYATYDNWLMFASQPSYILEDTKRMLYSYWLNETDLKHYFLFQLIMNIACERHRDEEAGIPIFSSEPCHVLQMEMLKTYNKHRFRQICSMSGVHKLTYKYDVSIDLKGTYLERILKP